MAWIHRRRPKLQYQPFGSPLSEIRLLTFKAESKYRRSSVDCTLYNYSLASVLDQDVQSPGPDHLPYVALSYTWGPSEDPVDDSQLEERSHTIRVNGQELIIGDNLFQALVQLKKCLPSGWPRNFWVDAICINQRDNSERSAQVQIMGDIFGLAEGVVVWLGEGSSDTIKSSVQYMLRVRKMVEDVRREAALQVSPAWVYWKYNIDAEARCKAAGWTLEGFSDSMWKSKLFQKRWWMRTWVVQEFALARKVCFLWGSTLLDLQALGEVIDFYTWQNQPPTWSSEAVMWSALRLLETREAIETGRPVVEPVWQRILLAPNAEMTGSCALLYLMYKTRRRQVSNPRDQIYSLAALAQRYCGSRIRIIPDYRKEPAEIYAEVVQYVVSESQWLGFLVFAGQLQVVEAAGLPSFVPHFRSFHNTSMPMWDSPILQDMDKALEKLLPAPDDGVPQLGDWVLYCYGICLGSLTEVLYLRELARRLSDETSVSQVKSFILSCEKTYRYMDTSPPRLEAIWKACLEGAHLHSGVLSTSHFSSWLLWNMLMPSVTDKSLNVEQVIEENPLARLLVDDTPEIRPSGRSTLEEYLPGLRARYQIFDVACREDFSSRRLFRTDNFHVGTCSKFAREGDTLWWLARCPFPMVLRKKNVEDPNSLYSLVGWAYVYGLYEGSVLDQVDKQWQKVRML